MAKRRRRKRRSAAVDGVVTQDASLESVYRRWDAMHADDERRATTHGAIKQCTWVYTAVTFIAEHVMRTPLAATRDGRQFERHPLLDFANRPNAYDDQNTSAKFRYAYMMELLLHGAVMRLLGGFAGFRPQTMAVRPRRHFRVRWAYDEFGRQTPLLWTLVRPAAHAVFTPGDTIAHDALYNPLHDFEGLSPLAAALLSAVATDSSAAEYANRFFENDGSTGLILSTDSPAFNQKQADEAAKKWKELHSGVRNAFGVKFVGFGLRPHPVGAPLDAKMLKALRSLTKEEIICGVYKIPLDAVTASEAGGDIVIGGPSGGTQASAREAFLVNVVQPWAQRYDEEFNRDVAWRFGDDVRLVHDFSNNPILERRRLERAKAAVELIDRGVTLNTVIDWLRLEIAHQPTGDEHWILKDYLPARLILEAGDDAKRIAIPDPVEKQRERSQEEHVQAIATLAQQRRVQAATRDDALIRRRGVGQTNAERVAELLRGNGAAATPDLPNAAPVL